MVSSQVMLSPRNSMILTRRVYLDPNVPPSPTHEHNAPIARNSGIPAHLDTEARLKHLSKHMNRCVEDAHHVKCRCYALLHVIGVVGGLEVAVAVNSLPSFIPDMNGIRTLFCFVRSDLVCNSWV